MSNKRKQIISVMNLEDKLKEKFGNQNPFSVPENYFDDFANKMQDLVKE